MQIVDFTVAHIEQAAQIAKQNYEEERRIVPALPPIVTVPDLTPYTKNGLGVAAFDGDAMFGFLCAVGPFPNAFRSTDAIMVFSPMGANGAIGDNRANTYAHMYQAAGEQWACVGAASHGICLYAHDTAAQEQFFRYGFGLRCVDAIRGMDDIIAPPCAGYNFSELVPEDVSEIYTLYTAHIKSYQASPFFMRRDIKSEAEICRESVENRPLCFVAHYGGQPVAYVTAEHDGETFICKTPDYMHANGAYCLPEHRGIGLNQTLLSMLVQKLKTQGYTRLGVDFESINPSGYGFWLKHFNAYTHSVVRRIDEHVITKR
jgi:GNAT superfamily N-acetyltransferase